jgi:hypothetical protein
MAMRLSGCWTGLFAAASSAPRVAQQAKTVADDDPFRSCQGANMDAQHGVHKGTAAAWSTCCRASLPLKASFILNHVI